LKKTIIVPVLLITLIWASSCNQDASPRGVATTWLNAFYHTDFEAAKKVSNDNTKLLMNYLSQMMRLVPDSIKQDTKKIKVNIKNVTETQDKATVIYTVSIQPDKELELNLEKVKNVWLVKYFKNDGLGVFDNGEAATKSAAQMPPADNTTPNVDTATAQDTNSTEKPKQ
jgi:hypothetical protein